MTFWGGNSASCEVYSRIHVGGPNGANSDWTLDYWHTVEECLNNGGHTRPPMVI